MLKLILDFESGAPVGMLARLVVRRYDHMEAPFALNSGVNGHRAHFEGIFSDNAEYVYTLASYFEGAAVNFEEHGRISVGCGIGQGLSSSQAHIGRGQCIEIRSEIV